MVAPNRRNTAGDAAAAAELSVDSARAATEAAGVAVFEREAGLRRNLTPRKLSMIALGGAIGAGLSLGSAVSAHWAGRGRELRRCALPH